jgi:hypothetical protein
MDQRAWVAGREIFAAPSVKRRHPTRSEGGGEQVAAEISFMSSPKRSPEQTAIMLHEELAIAPTWRANCQMVRSGQPTGVLIPVV